MFYLLIQFNNNFLFIKMERINTTLGDLGQRWNPFAQRLNRGFNQVKQYAQEKMGNIEDITKLPQEYLDLEEVFII